MDESLTEDVAHWLGYFRFRRTWDRIETTDQEWLLTEAENLLAKIERAKL